MSKYTCLQEALELARAGYITWKEWKRVWTNRHLEVSYE